MAKNEIQIDVNCNLCVNRNTAETCLKLVEFYVNSNANTLVQGTKNNDGTYSFCFVDSRL